MTVAHKAPLSMRFPRQEYWSGDFPGGSVVKTLPANAGDMGSIPGLGSCLRATKPVCHNY